MFSLIKSQLASPTTLTGSGIAALLVYVSVIQPLSDGKEITWKHVVLAGIGAALIILFAWFVPDRSDIPAQKPKEPPPCDPRSSDASPPSPPSA